MGAPNHPWLVEGNNDPRTPLGSRNSADKSQKVQYQGLDGKNLREEVNRTISFDSQEGGMESFIARQLALKNSSIEYAQRPEPPLLTDNNTSTQPGGFSEVSPAFGFGGGTPLESGGFTYPFEVQIIDGSAVVNPSSYLYKSLDHADVSVVTGLNTPLAISIGDAVWLEINFSSFPNTYTASVTAGAFPSGGEIEDNATPPVTQTVARLVLALIVDDGEGLPLVSQLVNTNRRMQMFNDAGLIVNYPRPA